MKITKTEAGNPVFRLCLYALCDLSVLLIFCIRQTPARSLAFPFSPITFQPPSASAIDFMRFGGYRLPILLIVRVCLFFLLMLLVSADVEARPALVVIDPGHGGYDRGGMPGQI